MTNTHDPRLPKKEIPKTLILAAIFVIAAIAAAGKTSPKKQP